MSSATIFTNTMKNYDILVKPVTLLQLNLLVSIYK